MIARRDFLWQLAGLAAVASLPAWAGGLEDGAAAWGKGDHAAAVRAWEGALAGETDPTRRVDLLLRLAAAHREQGALARADGRLVEAEATGLLPARVANDRGLWRLAAGDAPGAEAELQRAFELARGASDPALAATAASNLGLARLALGHPDDAGKAFAAATTLFASMKDEHGRADALTNAGIAHRRAGRLREARDALEEAVRLFTAAGDRLGRVDAQNDLGIVLQALGLDDRAAALYQDALDQKPDPRRAAALTANLATVYHRKGELPRARERYQAAEALLVQAGRPDDAVAVALQRVLLGTPDLAELRRLHASAKDPRVRATAALNLAGLVWTSAPQEALALAGEARSLGLGAQAWRADLLEGRVALAAGQRELGLTRLRAAVAALELTRRGLSEEESRGFRAEYAAVYEALVDANLGAGNQRGAAAAAEQLALADHDEPPVPSDAGSAELKALTERQVWLQRELAGASPERARALQAQLGAVQAEFSAQVDSLRANHPHFAELVRTDPEDLEAVRRELPAGVVVVQPVLLPARLVLLVYRRERLGIREVQVDAATVEKKVALAARSLRAADTWDPDWTRAQCEELGTWLWAPIADELADAGTVVVSATGVFRQLPFALLRHGGAWLVERATVANVTHVGSLRAAPGRFRLDGRALLLVGNPDGSLPGAEAEVGAIGREQKAAKVLIGPQGTREAVLAAATGRTAVHLATHGILDASFPDRSHIVLAGYPEPEGMLAYREIPGLGAFLDGTRVVVLSACESGLPGDVAAGAGRPPMAVNGLAGQFRRAGVETLVASLWSVDDRGTMALMTRFYAGLARGEDLGQALRNAQVSMLAEPDLAHPYYWAPFVLVGDWR